MKKPYSTTLCIVGAGPRGLSVVERVCANAAGEWRRLTVHLVDPHIDSGGRVWHTGQPRELLTNTVASQISMFTDESVRCNGPIRPGPDLFEWAKHHVRAGRLDLPAWAQAEAAALTPDSYPTRALYGHYLRWVLDHVIRTAPPQVTVVKHDQVATAVDDTPDGAQTVLLGNGIKVSRVDSVVLALGHVDARLSSAEQGLHDFAAANGLSYLPPGNPAAADLRCIGSGEPVALRGMGLNFFDYLALFTVGRGGEFFRADHGLTYRPSGREPVLYAGSRRGVPHHARGENQKGPTGRHEPLFLTHEVIEALRERHAEDHPVEFGRDVWPLVDREVRAVFYHTVLAERSGRSVANAFLAEYVGSPTEDVPRRFGIEESWDWNRVARPYVDREFATPADFHVWLLRYLRDDVAEARRGNVRGPLKAAVDVLRDIRNEIRLLVDHSGITGDSYRDELRSWYTPLNAFLSIGPPPHRVEEMIALLEAGVLTVVGPGMTVVPSGSCFRVSSTAVPDFEVTVTALVEARMPEVDVRATTDPIIQRLLERGACRPYSVPDPERPGYVTGGLAVTERPFRLVDAAGNSHPRRFAFGVPTEGVHWATAAGIRPGVDSVTLGCADAIAQACLFPEPEPTATHEATGHHLLITG